MLEKLDGTDFLHIGLQGPFTNQPFGIRKPSIFDLKVPYSDVPNETGTYMDGLNLW